MTPDPAFLQSDCCITRYGLPFSTFAENHPFFKFRLFSHGKLSKFNTFLPVLFLDTSVPDKQFVNIKTTYHAMFLFEK